MGSMSYCLFENTLRDLHCLIMRLDEDEVLNSEEQARQYWENLSEDEQSALTEMLEELPHFLRCIGAVGRAGGVAFEEQLGVGLLELANDAMKSRREEELRLQREEQVRQKRLKQLMELKPGMRVQIHFDPKKGYTIKPHKAKKKARKLGAEMKDKKSTPRTKKRSR